MVLEITVAVELRDSDHAGCRVWLAADDQRVLAFADRTVPEHRGAPGEVPQSRRMALERPARHTGTENLAVTSYAAGYADNLKKALAVSTDCNCPITFEQSD